MEEALRIALLTAIATLAIADTERRLDEAVALRQEADTLQLSLRILEERNRLLELSIAEDLKKKPAPEVEEQLRQMKRDRERHLARRAEAERRQF